MIERCVSGVMGTRPIRSVPFEIKMQISAPDAIDTVVNHVGIQGVEMEPICNQSINIPIN